MLTKLRPDRDLQCYFQEPSAVAALSEANATGFTVSGCWRQQFDWAVVEWNRDNVFEHPALRNLPDGDLSGVLLSYEETRTNCIPMDSTTYDSVGWSYLRVWEESAGQEQFHWVPLRGTPVEGEYVPATTQMELTGLPTVGDYVELSWLDQHANYRVATGDSLEMAASGLAGFINAKPEAGVTAVADGSRITLTYTGAPGLNGNRVGVYGSVQGSGTEGWTPSWAMFSGGISPTRWRVSLDFGNLVDKDGALVPATNVRKLRWTWSADLQSGNFERREFAVHINNWMTTGTKLEYRVAGPGSRRIEDDSLEVHYTGTWVEERGNYSGGSIRRGSGNGARVQCTYTAANAHTLLLGSRYVNNGGQIAVQVDGNTLPALNLKRPLEDVLIRCPLVQLPAGTHMVSVTLNGPTGSHVFFDFFELAVPTTELPVFDAYPAITLATDWDTLHSIAIAPERTAWLIDTLGFKGRANHYVGAMWFYELCCPDGHYAFATLTFDGTPQFGGWTKITIAGTEIAHQNYITDTAETIAKAFELLLTAGSSAIWAHAEGPALTITARAAGAVGNGIGLSAVTGSESFTATASSPHLSGGSDGPWLTDLSSPRRLNRAVRDWSRSYYRAMKGYGIEVTAAFSMELRHGDTRPEAAIAQRYPDGPVVLSTPAVQTNFGPASTSFWERIYREMAEIMTEAGVAPYLQFGEVQWWYFANPSGMPFYDDFTKNMFQETYGRPLPIIVSENADPAPYPLECVFLAGLIGKFTDTVMAFVRAAYPETRFEVLYPPDTNDTPLNRLVNYPPTWTAATLCCLKTENFTFTGNRDLNKARESILTPMAKGFPLSQSGHLVGIGDHTAPWLKEQRMAVGEGVESVVLFALDQFCLMGYRLPLARSVRRTMLMGR